MSVVIVMLKTKLLSIRCFLMIVLMTHRSVFNGLKKNPLKMVKYKD